MNGYVFGLVVVFATTLISVVGMLVVRKRVSLETLATYHEVAGYMLSVVGTLYAVLLGFVIVDAMEHMQDVRGLVSMEASGLANIYLCAQGLPDAKRNTIRALCVQYAHEVIDDEWVTLREGKYSQKTFRTVFRLWKEITTYVPAGEGEQNIHQQLVSEICSMTQNHRTRVISSIKGVAPVMWFVLITGGIFTVIFTYFFGVADIKIQSLMTVLVAITLSLNVYLVYVFGNPMSTDLGIRPGPFQLDLLIFSSFDGGEMPTAKPMNN
ncbi:MAG: DUF4239 domain-containing protein [Cyanobacteria bacterium SZAS LIN-3]|nr:DUF4239 domain-containing protein [Cyanobacteria bacterium SZAS LIN-3]